MTGNDNWIPLMDYAMKKGVSLSTLRRHIKANKIKYRVESGRYLLWDNEPGTSAPVDLPARIVMSTAQVQQQRPDYQRLERDLQKAQEEIAELKMLVAIYEEQISRERLDS